MPSTNNSDSKNVGTNIKNEPSGSAWYKKLWLQIKQDIITKPMEVALTCATVLLAFYTYGLWSATNGLLISDEIKSKQAAKDMRTSLELTISSVKAAQTLANSAASSVAIAQNEFIANQRAWIGPGGNGAVLVDKETNSAPIVGKPITAKVFYRNTGKTPAEMSLHVTMAAINADQWETKDFKNWISIFKNRCVNSVLSQKSIEVIYPSNTGGGYNTLINSNDQWLKNDGKDFRFNMSDEIKSGKKIIVALGCMTYKTFGRIRHSTFCFYYKAGDIAYNNLGYCPNGQYAD
jgi:hypothetical protein